MTEMRIFDKNEIKKIHQSQQSTGMIFERSIITRVRMDITEIKQLKEK